MSKFSKVVAVTAVFMICQSSILLAEEIPAWGETVDPQADCPIDRSEKGIQITIPGGRHDMNAIYQNTTAPRVISQITGDFVMQVKVVDFPMPAEFSVTGPPQKSSYIAAGLLLWQDEDNFVRWTRSAVGETKQVYAAAEIYQNGELTGGLNIKIPDSAYLLRLERRGTRISFWISENGRDWKQVVEKGVELKTPLKVGVFAMNVTKNETKFDFEDFYLLSGE